MKFFSLYGQSSEERGEEEEYRSVSQNRIVERSLADPFR